MKKFVAHKSKNKTFFKIGLLILVAVISLIISFNTFLKNSVEDVLGSGDVEVGLFNKGVNNKPSISLNILNPKELFRLGLNSMFDVKLSKELEDIKMLNNHENASEPLVYIYNTHDMEAYSSSLIESYNVRYNVKMASYILSDYLKDLNIPSYVEESSTTELVNTMEIYENNYEASRDLIEKRQKEYPSIKYFIDIHRDAVDEQETTKVEIDGKKYAMLMFVIGEENAGYQENLALAETINSKLDPRLTKGIIKKSGEGVNGIYNQDISKNAILVEVGSEENTIEEVDNSLEVLARTLMEVINSNA